MNRDAYDFWAERIPAHDVTVIRQFWRSFGNAAPRIQDNINGSAPFDVEAFMIDALAPVEAMILWEFGDGEDVGLPGSTWLALTPEFSHEHRDLARAFIHAAPDMQRWSFHDARPPIRDDDMARQAVEGRLGGPSGIEQISAHVGAHGGIDIEATVRGDTDQTENAIVMFSVVAGEGVMQDRLGDVRPTRAKRSIGNLFQSTPPVIAGFRKSVADALTALETEIGDTPFAPPYDEAQHHVFTFKPRVNDAGERVGIISYTTTRLDFAEAVFGNIPIVSARFSRHRETLLTMSIQKDMATKDIVANLVPALDADLRPSGGVFAEGIGTSHNYVSFAALSVDVGVDVANRVAARFGIGGAADIRFHAAGLENKRHPLSASTTKH